MSFVSTELIHLRTNKVSHHQKLRAQHQKLGGTSGGLAYFFIKESKADFIEIRVFSVIFFIRAFS
jgi:hypothetical protein